MNDWSKAEAHAEKARELFQAGQWGRALAEIKRALAVNPDQSDWHFGMGLTLDAMQRYKDAIKSFEKVLMLRGEDVETMLHLGCDLIRSGRLRRAIKVLERVNEIDSNCESGYCYRIAAYAQLGDHEQAETMFYMARQVTDECAHCYDHIAQSFYARGELDRSVWCWGQALELDPHYLDARANIARAQWKAGHLEEARKSYLEQLREDPGDTASILHLGELLVEMGYLAEATEKFNRAAENEPELSDPHLSLAEIAIRAGRLEGAEKSLGVAMRLSPERPGVRLRLAQVAAMRGRSRQARKLLRLELGLTGHSQSQLLDLSRLLIELKQTRPAMAVLNSLLAGSPDSWEDTESKAAAMLYRSVGWVQLGRVDKGITDCRRSLRLEPKNTTAIQNLVYCYTNERRYLRALCWLEKAIEMDSENPKLLSLRTRLRLAVIVRRFTGIVRWFGVLKK